MDYEKLMLKIKNKYFPELQDVKIKPMGRFHLKFLKITHGLTPDMATYRKTIYYNKKTCRNFNIKELSGVFAHELAHILQKKKLNWFQYIVFLLKYDASKLEKQADRIAIRKGFGKGLISARRNKEKTLSKKELDRRRKIYYSPEELEKLVYSKK
jgi:hypothetical protein